MLTLEYVSVPETTIPYSYGATPELLRQELEIKAEPDKLIRELTADEMDAVRTIIDAMVKMALETVEVDAVELLYSDSSTARFLSTLA